MNHLRIMMTAFLSFVVWAILYLSWKRFEPWWLENKNNLTEVVYTALYKLVVEGDWGWIVVIILTVITVWHLLKGMK